MERITQTASSSSAAEKEKIERKRRLRFFFCLSYFHVIFYSVFFFSFMLHVLLLKLSFYKCFLCVSSIYGVECRIQREYINWNVIDSHYHYYFILFFLPWIDAVRDVCANCKFSLAFNLCAWEFPILQDIESNLENVLKTLNTSNNKKNGIRRYAPAIAIESLILILMGKQSVHMKHYSFSNLYKF